MQAQILAAEAGKRASNGGMRLVLLGFCCERAGFLVELLSLVQADERRMRQKGVAQVCRPSLITCALPAGCSSALFTHDAALHRCSGSTEGDICMDEFIKTASKCL